MLCLFWKRNVKFSTKHKRVVQTDKQTDKADTSTQSKNDLGMIFISELAKHCFVDLLTSSKQTVNVILSSVSECKVIVHRKKENQSPIY